LQAAEEELAGVNRMMSLAASSYPDILYLHEALAADDRVEFIKAMQREVQAHVENKNWALVKRTEIPNERKSSVGDEEETRHSDKKSDEM
jgi:hypothetical protein